MARRAILEAGLGNMVKVSLELVMEGAVTEQNRGRILRAHL